MNSIFSYSDYRQLLRDAAAGLVHGIQTVTLAAHSRLVRRILVEDDTCAILFSQDLSQALGLGSQESAHLRNLMERVQR